MLFNSHVFMFLFLPMTLTGFWIISQQTSSTWARYFLTASSLLFYMYGAGTWIALLLASASINYILAHRIAIAPESRRSIWLAAGIVFNLGLLVFFKYGFVQYFFARDGYLLPLAISYFTFHQLAYLVDVRTERVKAEQHFSDYLLFVSFFPHLLAGPIVYYRDLMPQLRSPAMFRPDMAMIRSGCYLFAIGLAKKTVIADPLSNWVDSGFTHATELSSFEVLLLGYLFALQLYFDFSGYSDMAIGLARLFNIRFPINFNSPYKSTSIIQFWQHWNITLTHFIQSYVYTPLVRLKPSFSMTYSLACTFIAMLAIGLWHGHGTHFLVFGAAQGLALVINHLWRKTGIHMGERMGVFLTLHFWCFSLLIFRSTDMEQALTLFQQLLSLQNGWIAEYNHFVSDTNLFVWMLIPATLKDIVCTGLIVCLTLLMFTICLRCRNSIELAELVLHDNRHTFRTGILLAAGILMITGATPFIYFHF